MGAGDKTRECTTLQRRLDAAATAIGVLYHDNTLLREELAAHGATVIPCTASADRHPSADAPT
ncbi:hypothetical protein ACFYP6_21955 [Streptomyces goshikiensis]|uniref:hypothetical protein n=1 Tax=Streptomyces goshikiensis TaxID=1942 RepID=UPI0036803CCF